MVVPISEAAPTSPAAEYHRGDDPESCIVLLVIVDHIVVFSVIVDRTTKDGGADQTIDAHGASFVIKVFALGDTMLAAQFCSFGQDLKRVHLPSSHQSPPGYLPEDGQTGPG